MGLIVGAGCGPTMIEGTEIEATPERQELYDLVQQYRRAIEERDVQVLRSMISREYFDNAATTDRQDDDYGFEVLNDRMIPILRDNVKKVRMDVRVTGLEVQGARAWATFEYIARFLFTEGGKDGWVTRNDFNRLDFVREDGSWRIISGL